MMGGAESSRDWFCRQNTFAAGVGGSIVLAVPNKRPIITYCSVTVLIVAAANSVEISGAPSGARAFQAPVSTIGTFFMGRLYKGVSLDFGDSVDVVFSGGAATIDVVVEGYYTLS